MCHAKTPTPPAFAAPPKDVALETIGEVKASAEKVFEQTVRNRGMPMGNQTGMTEDERDALSRWIGAARELR